MPRLDSAVTTYRRQPRRPVPLSRDSSPLRSSQLPSEWFQRRCSRCHRRDIQCRYSRPAGRRTHRWCLSPPSYTWRSCPPWAWDIPSGYCLEEEPRPRRLRPLPPVRPIPSGSAVSRSLRPRICLLRARRAACLARGTSRDEVLPPAPDFLPRLTSASCRSRASINAARCCRRCDRPLALDAHPQTVSVIGLRRDRNVLIREQVTGCRPGWLHVAPLQCIACCTLLWRRPNRSDSREAVWPPAKASAEPSCRRSGSPSSTMAKCQASRCRNSQKLARPAASSLRRPSCAT